MLASFKKTLLIVLKIEQEKICNGEDYLTKLTPFLRICYLMHLQSLMHLIFLSPALSEI